MSRSVFLSKRSLLPDMFEWVEGFLEASSLDSLKQKELFLAIEEALVNVIRYGYGKGKEGRISIEIQDLKDHVTVTFQDEGLPFNPLKYPPFKKEDIPLEKRRTGGLGIFFMRKMSDDIVYKREGGCNILTLKKWV